MTVSSNLQRPHWSEPIAVTQDGQPVIFNDQMNKFIEDIITELTQAGSGVTYDGGSFASANNGVLDGGSFT